MAERLEDLFKIKCLLGKETDIVDYNENDETKPLNNTKLVCKAIQALDIVRMMGNNVGECGVLLTESIDKKRIKNLSNEGMHFLDIVDSKHTDLLLTFERTREGVVEISLSNTVKRMLYSVHKTRKIHYGYFQELINGNWVKIKHLREPELEDLVTIANVGRDIVLSNSRGNSA